MRRRRFWIVLSVVMVAAVVTAAFLLRRRAAPEPARLLPEADAYLYFNLKPLRKLGLIGNNPPAVNDADYAQFVRETGFQFERDLDDAAFAVHATPRTMDIEPAAGEGEQFRRYSEVFRGHFDSQRAHAYFGKIAKAKENYREVRVYSIPLEGRTVRVALLGVGMVAVSNTDGPQALHYIIDRYKELALPFGGPSLVKEYYSDVPFASLLWGIARVTNPGGKRASVALPGGLDLFFPNDTVVVASVRYTTDIQVKAEAFTGSPEQAKQVADQASAFLTIFHSLENTISPTGSDPDVKAFFNSLSVQQNQSRTVLTATMTPAFLKKIFSAPPAHSIVGSAPESEEEPKAAAPKRKRKRK
jgi:hypothetical protein